MLSESVQQPHSYADPRQVLGIKDDLYAAMDWLLDRPPAYKRLSVVERAFRSLKTVDLKVRPIHHRAAGRVRAHVFLCMLAYYVEWHMRARLKPL